MKKKQWPKIILLVLAILACISIPIILYFTIGQNNNSTIDLGKQNISYSAEVEYMNSINASEATKIKGDIEAKINKTLNKLTIDIDYTISNLDKLVAGANLDGLTIGINSVPTSEKATGSTFVALSVTENINGRSIDTITVRADQEDGLDALNMNNILRNIKINLDDLFSEGQSNEEGRDYQIVNKDLIRVGAKFSEYADAISVKALASSTHLKGEFKINFQLE